MRCRWTGKVKYHSWLDAAGAVNAFRVRREMRSLGIWRCQHCGDWHAGKTEHRYRRRMEPYPRRRRVNERASWRMAAARWQ